MRKNRAKAQQFKKLREAQAGLERSRDRYLDLYDFAPVGYFTFDRKGLILEVNLRGADLLGVERRFIQKRLFSRFIAKEDQDVFYLHRKKVLETGTKQTCELKLLRKDG